MAPTCDICHDVADCKILREERDGPWLYASLPPTISHLCYRCAAYTTLHWVLTTPREDLLVAVNVDWYTDTYCYRDTNVGSLYRLRLAGEEVTPPPWVSKEYKTYLDNLLRYRQL